MFIKYYFAFLIFLNLSVCYADSGTEKATNSETAYNFYDNIQLGGSIITTSTVTTSNSSYIISCDSYMYAGLVNNSIIMHVKHHFSILNPDSKTLTSDLVRSQLSGKTASAKREDDLIFACVLAGDDDKFDIYVPIANTFYVPTTQITLKLTVQNNTSLSASKIK